MGHHVLEGIGGGLPHVIKVDPAGCERAPGSCNALNEFWNAVARAFPDQIWRLSCEDQPFVCAHHLSSPVEPGHDPVFEFWSDSGLFSRYSGSPSPDALLLDVFEFLGRQDVLDEFNEQKEDVTDAYGAARSAAAEYVRRRTQSREIEGLLSSGSPSALRRARGMSKAYLRRYGGHMNAVLLAASAAQMDGDLSEAMSLIKHASMSRRTLGSMQGPRLYTWQRSSMCRLWII